MQAQKLAIKNSSVRLVRWIPRALPLAGLAGLAFLVYVWLTQGFKITMIWGLLFSWWFISLPFVMRRGQKKAYANTKSFHGSLAIDADDNGVRIRANGIASQTDWSNFASFFEDDKSFAITQGNSIFHPVPKRFLSTEQVNELRECLKQNIGQRK
ncbi:MAG TPA: YcxB family protein [Candidatus Angelobacter sp.]